LNLISGIALAQSGTIQVAGNDVSQLSDKQRRDFRVANTGFVFQRFELIEYLNVKDNILFPFLINSSIELTSEVRARMLELAESVGIARLLKRYPRQLSQGEQQRVAICRAMILSPPLVLADEPTGNLDPANKQIILDLMLGAFGTQDRTFVLVTHDQSVAEKCDRIIDFSSFHRQVQTDEALS
jgi:ABC-type lipoprotein export system ATPase subunit